MKTGDWQGSPTAAGAVIGHLWKNNRLSSRQGTKGSPTAVCCDWLLWKIQSPVRRQGTDNSPTAMCCDWLRHVSKWDIQNTIACQEDRGLRSPTATSSCDCWYYLWTWSRLSLAGWSFPPPVFHATKHNLWFSQHTNITVYCFHVRSNTTLHQMLEKNMLAKKLFWRQLTKSRALKTNKTSLCFTIKHSTRLQKFQIFGFVSPTSQRQPR